MSLFKKERFSIRKICGIVGSVLLGSILVAPSIIHASTYHYIEKSSLTQEEQTKIQAGIPTDNEKTYALIYQQETLPATGSSTSVLTALGLLAIGSLVLLVHKKKKVASLFLVTTIGLIGLSSMQALDISNPLKAPSNEGVVQIAGYRYIGYLPLNDDAISEIQHKDEGTKDILAPDKTMIRSIQSEINTSFTQSEKSEIQSVHNEAPKAEKPKNPESVSTVPNETTKSEKPEYTAPVGTVPDEAPKAEKPEHTAPASGNLVESEVHEQPEYTAPIGDNLVEPEVHEKPAYTKPIGTVPDEAPKVEKTEYTAPVGTVPDEAPKTEKPEYTEPVGATGVDEKGNLIEPPVSEKPEYTEPVGTTGVDEKGNLIEPPVSEKPAYTEPVGTIGVDENGNLLEPPISKKTEYTEPVSTVSEVASEREELPSLHTDIRKETIPKTTIEESDLSKFIGDDSVKQVGEDGERQIVTSYEELHGKKISESVETVTILKEMKPEILVKGTKEKPKEKTAPVLTLERTDTNVLDRSANLSYHLVNTDGVKINKITATIKDGNEIVKTVDLTSEQLDKQVEDLKFYKDYKIETTMTYDRGKGEETATLEEKPLRLDLKKVEIKNITSTNLVKVNDDGTETPSDFMTEKPSDDDVKKMYLKITSRDNKVTRLAVDKIELVTEEGQKLYKITAEAQDLIQHTDPTKVRNKYVHYIEKPVPKVDDVYYNFKELVDAMNADKNGTFKIGADLNATNVPTPKKWYVDGDFRGTLKSVDGKHYTIHNTERPLFKNIIGGTVTKVNLGNVNINMPWADRIAPIADTIKGGAKIEDVKVTGNVLGKNWVSGFIDKIDNQGTLRNVAFIGNVTSVGDGGQFLTGIVGENWKGVIDKAYVDANIIGNRAQAAGIVYSTQNGGDNHSYSREGVLTNSVAKGTLYVKDSLKSGGLVGNNWMLGMIKNNVSMMKVKNGEIAFGHSDIDQDSYYTSERVINTYTVNGISEGNKSYNRSNIIKGISKEEADNIILTYNITANTYEMPELLVDRLNRFVTHDNEYKTTQDYKAEREQAYRNIEKLQPFYNKEWIVNQGNKLTGESNLVKKTVLSVTGMKAGQFVTDLSDIDKIMVHYADGTKEEMNVTVVADSKVKQVREYSIDGLDDVVYTPNMVVKNRDKLIADVKDQLSSVELISQEVRALMDKRDTSRDPNANSDERKNGYIKDLFFEESFAEVKENLGKLVKAIVENEDHQLNDNELAERALLKKVEDNKAKIMMGLAYLNQYYGFKYDELSIKDIMMFKPDFYGKNVNVLDFLIKIGSSERNVKGDRTLEAYRETIGGTIGINELNGFLHYNMKLFTNHTDINDWFKKAIEKNAYVVEQPSTNPAFANKKYRLYEGINNGQHGRMILPLLNLKNAHLFMISTYNTISFSSFEKYGKDTAEKREAFKSEINKRAKEQVNYLDFWSRLATDNVRDKLLKSQNGVPTPVWDNHNAPGGWPDRFGHRNGKPDYTPVREFFGRIGKYHPYQYGYGAYAYIFAAPQPMDAVYFVMTDLISDFGTSAFTHETTHVNDRMAYYGGHWHRQGTDLEAFAQGMLQTPSVSNPNGEYGALGLNMAYHRENNGEQWYNYDPDKLKTREDIDRYMKNYNEALMMLDYVEADAVIPKLNGDNSKWFKKIDRVDRHVDGLNKLTAPHQWDKVRDLNDGEKTKPLASIDDLVDNNFMTKHNNPGNGVFRPEDFTPNSAYVNVQMMAGIYGGNTSKGAPGSLSFKHNAFRMWGYFGYENGFIGYVSSKYQGEANRENNKLLGDDFIIKKVSKGVFNTLEEWKKQYFKDVKSKAEKGFETIEIDGRQITNYAQLKTLFAEAVQKDLDGMSDPKIKDHFKNTVDLKSKVFKALLKNTDGFFNQLFKEDI
ncbi:SIALI-17 repeat-containing surface protein [Streptococcus pneumoniae]|uniref:SIALI-17 repeat-containing surface protein n=1 Tax=Streptococcus pneumoniae TaxID=1313 RepID=UPI0005E2500A|nr:SIALI-17 repeat-containing surface protein [Streptococcus pneumoniae]CIQ27405.1 zinc metalloprotease [Streptococcus pneumoniae]CIR32510.1 zinc metalloprotease [Streptococcus pneumoniae]CIY83285.1 zinc metalloprotease [Streptococcus pneumoniae]